MATLRLEVGTVVGNAYRVVRALSEGGMGAVYVAEHVPTKRERALKIMHPELVGSQKLRERFVQEAQIAACIRSDHVVDVTDAGVDVALGLPWLAMELLTGETLAARCARGPLDALTVRTVFAELCHALAAAHDAGVVHRDLKPENIFLAEAHREGATWTVKVLDFGIAKLLTDAKKSATGALGTPLYMPPEQMVSGRVVTPAADVWALGLIAFHLLTGKNYWLSAHEESSSMMVLNEVVNLPLVPASQRATALGMPSLPAGFDAWFARCVNRDPNARFQHARELRAALEAVLPLGATVVSAQTPPVIARAARARRRVPTAVYVASGVAVLVIATVAVLLILRRSASTSSSKKSKSSKATSTETAEPAPSAPVSAAVPTETDPCPFGATCHPIAFADPKAVELDDILQRVLSHAKSQSPAAALTQIMLRQATRGNVVDLTIPAQSSFLIYNIPPGKTLAVQVTPTRLETFLTPHSAQQEPLTLACSLKKALDVAGAAGFPLPTLEIVQVYAALPEGTTWVILSKVDSVYVDGQTCTVRSKNIRRR